MSTSDQQEQGPLTRKQLREIRLTGSTPVITPEEAAADAAAKAPPAPPLPSDAEPFDAATADDTPADAASSSDDAPAREVGASHRGESAEDGAAPLTRRQVRERERSRTASVPVVDEQEERAADDAAVEDTTSAPVPVTAVPSFTSSVPNDDIDDADVDLSDQIVASPVSASKSDDSAEAPVIAEIIEPSPSETAVDDDPVAAVAALGVDVETSEKRDENLEDDVLSDVDDSDDVEIADGERPTVNSAFGQEILTDPAAAQKPFSPSFDELLTVGDSTGSQHLAPNTLIFNPGPGDGSLSGPVASTGEILVTGSYELPRGLGSQGHAHGTTDGKDIDAVLIDGELAPSSSPTPIAASAAVSTIKPAGEVIRPPAPDKGNKLMLILAIVAGGLALALGVALIVAFTTNVF